MCHDSLMDHRLESEELAATWLNFKTYGDLESRNALTLHYQPLVRTVSSKIASRLPKMVDREDLASYGLFGLLDAIEKYDLNRNVKFETYAATRITGSIFDEIRGLDWVPRTVRAKARDVERAQVELHVSLGRPPADQEVATHLGITLVELWAVQTKTEAGVVDTYDADSSDGIWDVLQMRTPVEADTPETLFDTTEVSALLAEAIDLLPQRFKTILTLYYLQGMTLAEIGEVLGVTESRVCQLQSKLLQTLHASLSQGLSAAA